MNLDAGPKTFEINSKTVAIESKERQWLGAAVYSEGKDNNVVVSFPISYVPIIALHKILIEKKIVKISWAGCEGFQSDPRNVLVQPCLPPPLEICLKVLPQGSK